VRAGQGLGGPCQVVLAEERQVEEPFAGIVDDVEVELAAAEAAVEERPGLVADGQPELADPPRRIGPDPLVDQVAHVVLVVESRHIVVGLRRQRGAGDASAGISLEQGQAAAMDQVVDEGGDEDRLAGAGKAGHTEAERRRDDAGSPFGEGHERKPRLVGYGGKLQTAPPASDMRRM